MQDDLLTVEHIKTLWMGGQDAGDASDSCVFLLRLFFFSRFLSPFLFPSPCLAPHISLQTRMLRLSNFSATNLLSSSSAPFPRCCSLFSSHSLWSLYLATFFGTNNKEAKERSICALTSRGWCAQVRPSRTSERGGTGYRS
jgi:hypothetical protein